MNLAENISVPVVMVLFGTVLATIILVWTIWSRRRQNLGRSSMETTWLAARAGTEAIAAGTLPRFKSNQASGQGLKEFTAEQKQSITEAHRSLEPLRELFFGDQPLQELKACQKAEMVRIDPTTPTEAENDWSRLFMLALARQRHGDADGTRKALHRAANLPDVEARVWLWAWKALRDLGETPDSASANEVLGVVIEVAMDLGTDTLAVYADGSARYINQAGIMCIWERRSNVSDDLIRTILNISQQFVDSVPLGPRNPGPLPAGLDNRFTFLTRAGTRISIVARDKPPSNSKLGELLVAGANIVHFLLVQQLEQRGDHEKAIQTNIRHYGNRGNARAAQGDVNGAIGDYTKAMELQADNAQGYINRAAVFQLKGDYKRALADCNQAIKLDPSSASAYNVRALVHKSLKKYSKAVADCDKAIQLQAEFAEAHGNRGALYLLLNEPQKALADLERFVELGGKPDDAHGARMRAARQLVAVPIKVLGKVIRLNARGIQRAKQGDLNRAFADFSEVIRIAPDFAASYNNRGNVRRFQKRFLGALDDYKQAILLDPDYPEAYFGRGLAYLDHENFGKADADFTSALEINPKFLLAYRMRGMARLDAGDLDGAFADLTHYVNTGGAHQHGDYFDMVHRLNALAKRRAGTP